MDHRTQIGDLVSIENWDCEGIERPYGFRIYDKMDWDAKKQKTAESLIGKVRITTGSKALVTGRETVALEYDTDVMFWCLVEGKNLIVSQRFIHKLD
jgi:hypothetical protein